MKNKLKEILTRCEYVTTKEEKDTKYGKVIIRNRIKVIKASYIEELLEELENEK